MRTRRMRNVTFVCQDGDPAVQCSYVSYGGFFEAREKGWPIHEHKREYGAVTEWAHGPAEKCKRGTP